MMFHVNTDLKLYEKKVHSQFGEDGVIAKIAECLGIEAGTFFEFGIGPAWGTTIDDGLEGNFVLLRESGWKGVFLDSNSYPPKLNVHREVVTAFNINSLYRDYGLPMDLDFMSIDVDGQEFWIWMSLAYRPKVMVVEYNGAVAKDVSITIQFDLSHAWDGTIYHGASLLALQRLGRSKSYTLVYSNGVNAVFIRDDLLANASEFDYDEIYASYPPHPADARQRPWVQVGPCMPHDELRRPAP